ncbi:interferon-induced transmembrane protein 3-like [Amphiura filiformis]|uniref:interferon-induced transmembrane protein 3-like n=1 Tax=Amphiura filiformis TaxID=82378 RepID=UPI003B2198E6
MESNNEEDQQPPPYMPYAARYANPTAAGIFPSDHPPEYPLYTPQVYTPPSQKTTTVAVGSPPVADRHPSVAVRPPRNKTIVRTTQEVGPPTYMVWSILNTFFCCCLFGVFAICKSNEVSDHMHQGNVRRALQASKSARGWNILATITGIIGTAIVVVMNIF